MPTYQYVCTECGTPLEVVQSFTDDALVECPTCGGRLRKVFSAVGVVFKGSGFYRNDSRSEKTKVGAGTKSGGETKTSEGAAAGDSKKSSDGAAKETPAAKPKDSSSPSASTSSSTPSTTGGKSTAPKA